jgi:dipeptide/tripeptide permease
MAEAVQDRPPKLSWKFPPTFWYANGAELCERAAYYGMFITLLRYLNKCIGFSDVVAGWLVAGFASILYFLPAFMGIFADRVGFRRALILAFALLTVGYALLGIAGTQATRYSFASVGPAGAVPPVVSPVLQFGDIPSKLLVVAALLVIMIGGAIVKPVISGTAAKCSDSAHRARAMSIFYMIVNIGSFSGKGLAGELNDRFGLQPIHFCAAGMTLAALVLVVLFYRDVDTHGTGKTFAEAARGLLKVLANLRFLSLILIVAGFWAIQSQLYASMPTYVERMLGKGYKPEWLANINPAVVVLMVVPVTHLIRRFRPENAIGIALLIIPFTALIIALNPVLARFTGGMVQLGPVALHPLIATFIVGIGLQGLGECFLSPKFYEFTSKQAPPGEVGLYMGYQSLTQFFAQLFAFVLSGYLLQGFCPDPRTLPADIHAQWQAALAGQAAMPAAYAHAHYLWYAFAAVGFTAFVALLVFKLVTASIDRRRAGQLAGA